MKSIFGRWTMAAAMVFTLFLAGLVMAGTSFGAGGQEYICVDNEDGTVTDKNTGLMWQKAPAGPRIWKDAMNYASGLSLGDHSDWRLPTRDELMGLYNSPCKRMMDGRVHTTYWSSSFDVYHPGSAWRVDFDDGFVHHDFVPNGVYVRAVRAGQ